METMKKINEQLDEIQAKLPAGPAKALQLQRDAANKLIDLTQAAATAIAESLDAVAETSQQAAQNRLETARAAKELLPQIEPGELPRSAAARLDLLVLDEEEVVRDAARETLAAFPAAAADYLGGKQAAIGRLIGETIRRTGGRASPDQVRRILEEELART